MTASLPSTRRCALTSAQVCSSQRRLAEITEMLHAASLMHDDVIDESLTRRGSPSANAAFGNKVSHHLVIPPCTLCVRDALRCAC